MNHIMVKEVLPWTNKAQMYDEELYFCHTKFPQALSSVCRSLLILAFLLISGSRASAQVVSVCDVGFNYFHETWSNPWAEGEIKTLLPKSSGQMTRDFELMRRLGATAVRIHGVDPDRVQDAIDKAHSAGLKIWLSFRPNLFDLGFHEYSGMEQYNYAIHPNDIKNITHRDQVLPKIRDRFEKQFGEFIIQHANQLQDGDCLIVANELNIDLGYEIHGDYEHMQALIERLLAAAKSVKKKRVELTYATYISEYEKINFNDLRDAGLDFVSVNAYWDISGTDGFTTIITNLNGSGMPVAVTECGSVTHPFPMQFGGDARSLSIGDQIEYMIGEEQQKIGVDHLLGTIRYNKDSHEGRLTSGVPIRGVFIFPWTEPTDTGFAVIRTNCDAINSDTGSKLEHGDEWENGHKPIIQTYIPLGKRALAPLVEFMTSIEARQTLTGVELKTEPRNELLMGIALKWNSGGNVETEMKLLLQRGAPDRGVLYRYGPVPGKSVFFYCVDDSSAYSVKPIWLSTDGQLNAQSEWISLSPKNQPPEKEYESANNTIVVTFGREEQSESEGKLDVPYVAQGLTNWCSGAVQCMLLRYYGQPKLLWQLAADYGWAPEDGLFKLRFSVDKVKDYLQKCGLEMEWYNWRHLPPWRVTSCTSDKVFEWVSGHLAHGRPVMMLLSATEADARFPGHAVMATGYEIESGNRYLYVHDPSGALVNNLKSSIGSNAISAEVRVDWEEFFDVRKGFASSWLGAALEDQPEPIFGTLHPGRGARPATNQISGFTNIELYCGEGFGNECVGGLKLNGKAQLGLEWRSLGAGQSARSVDEAAPTEWRLGPNAMLQITGSLTNLDNVIVTDPRTGAPSYSVAAILKSEQTEISRETKVTIQQGGAPVGLYLPLHDLPSGTYDVFLKVKQGIGADAKEFYTIVLPPLTLSRESPDEKGMLDCVFCIDKSGSMADDIAAVKASSETILKELDTYASGNNISLQVGLVTYGDHEADTEWLSAWPMTSNTLVTRNNISAIQVAGGGDYKEDLYAALMCAMDRRADGKGNPVSMGWRHGAAKIIIPMADAPGHDPDFEGRTLGAVSRRALELDPVHMYPILLPRQGSSFLDPAVRGMEKIAKATKGEVVRVNKAEDLPEAIVATVKLAVRQHRNEVWRQSHPPYVLYGTLFGIAGLALIAIAYLFLRTFTARK